jgi:hypothetical protein
LEKAGGAPSTTAALTQEIPIGMPIAAYRIQKHATWSL